MPRAGTVTVRFTSRWPYNVGSWAVARLSGSRDWSHCQVIADGRMFEASMTHGCREGTPEQGLEGVKRYRDMQVTVPDMGSLFAFLERQRGKSYDWLGAAGIPLLYSDSWADERCWWCSELVFAALMAGGVYLLDPAEARRVTPNDLHQCYFPKTPVVWLPLAVPAVQ